MPKTKTNYQNTCIYMLKCCNDTCDDIYVGSTTNFTKRKYAHKSSCNNPNSKNHNRKKYQIIRENGGWDEWKMIEIEKYPCNDKRDAERREEYWRLKYKANMNTFRCWTDGKCNIVDCDNKSVKGGVCVRHGAEHKRCSVQDCNNKSQKGGVCVKHGAKMKRCFVHECDNVSVKDGVCVKHGAVRKRCSVQDCNNLPRKGGLCTKHGAVRKRCSIQDCNNQSVKGRLCIKHQQPIKCSCGKLVKPSNMNRHIKTKYHIEHAPE